RRDLTERSEVDNLDARWPAKQAYIGVSPKTDGSSLPLRRLSSSIEKRASTRRGAWYSRTLSINPVASRVKIVIPQTSSPKILPSHSRYVLPASTVSFVAGGRG